MVLYKRDSGCIPKPAACQCFFLLTAKDIPLQFSAQCHFPTSLPQPVAQTEDKPSDRFQFPGPALKWLFRKPAAHRRHGTYHSDFLFTVSLTAVAAPGPTTSTIGMSKTVFHLVQAACACRIARDYNHFYILVQKKPDVLKSIFYHSFF